MIFLKMENSGPKRPEFQKNGPIKGEMKKKTQFFPKYCVQWHKK